MSTTIPQLSDVPTSALTRRLYEIRNGERLLLVELLAHLAELDNRRAFIDLGFPSCFAFLCEHLGYTRSSAFRRTTAARLLARFPVVAEHLADGRLCLTTLVELRDVLCEERLDEILSRAAGRTEEQVKELACALRPRPAPPDLLRRLPQQRGEPAPVPVPVPVDGAGPAPSTGTGTAPPPAAAAERERPRLVPISEELRVLRITVGREFVTDLEAVRCGLSHVVPDGNLVRVLHECLRRTRRELERRQSGAAEHPRARAPTGRLPSGRTIPAAVRREVWRRDGGTCTFIGSDGHRCGSRIRLELHHETAHAKGGLATAENLRLMCSVHNRRIAEQELGAEHIARARAQAESARQMALL